MGAAITKNVQKTTVKAISKIATSMMNGIDLTLNNSQIISVSHAKDVKISDVKQYIKATVNMQGLMSALSTTSAQQDLTTELTQAAKSIVSGVNIFQASDAENYITAYVKAVMDISTQISQACSAHNLNEQVIDVSYVSGLVDIQGIDQTIIADMIGNCILDAISSTDAVQNLQTSVDQSAHAESKGFSFGWIALIVAMVLIAMVFGVGSVVNKAMSKLVFIVAILLLIGGVVFLLMYFLKPNITLRMKPHSNLIANRDDCGAVPLGDTSTNYSSSVKAGNACLDNDKCVAVDYQSGTIDKDGSMTPFQAPVTTFYRSLRQNPCDVIMNTSNDRRMVINANVAKGTGAPSTDLPGNEGDVYVNLHNLQYYIFKIGSGWNKQDAQLSKDPINLSSQNVWLTQSQPLISDGKIGDWWIDFSNPKVWSIYTKTGSATDSTWETNNTITLTGSGYQAIDLCGVFNQSTDDSNSNPDTPTQVISCINASGFKVIKPVIMYLIIGITGIVLGLILLGMGWGMSKSEVKSKSSSKSKIQKKPLSKKENVSIKTKPIT